ncbi:MAG: hypothetical protein GY832_11700 [Chloroflexi bacterium]|nr:hypothetical protein [Chloroflexota bacterium]
MTTYKGIDYGMGQTNIDAENGIRYGVISVNRLNEWAYEDFEADYGDPCCPKCGNEAKDYSDYPGESDDEMDTWEHAEHECDDYICCDCQYVFGSESAYGEEPVGHTLDKDGYRGCLDSHNDVMLTKSPYFTHAQFCSPCVPGAGHMENPCPDGPQTYCFGPDWFDGDKAPYPVYSVETGNLVCD